MGLLTGLHGDGTGWRLVGASEPVSLLLLTATALTLYLYYIERAGLGSGVSDVCEWECELIVSVWAVGHIDTVTEQPISQNKKRCILILCIKRYSCTAMRNKREREVWTLIIIFVEGAN